MDDMKELRARLGRLADITGHQFDGLGLGELGDLHRALRAALVEVEEALAPKIVDGARRGKTYVELAVAAGYGSTTTITKIIREQGASGGRGSNQAPFRRRRAPAPALTA